MKLAAEHSTHDWFMTQPIDPDDPLARKRRIHFEITYGGGESGSTTWMKSNVTLEEAIKEIKEEVDESDWEVKEASLTEMTETGQGEDIWTLSGRKR